MRKKILITGSGGFIFSNFIRRALFENNKYNLISIDRVEESAILNNIYTNKSHAFFIGDVTDAHLLSIIFKTEKPDIVIHGAAHTHVDNSIKDNIPFIKSNVQGTQTIIDACVKYGVEKLIYISTDEIYGHLSDESAPAWTEESAMLPRNPYSASKAAGELLVQAAGHTHGLKYIITRSSNNFGPRQGADKLIPKIIRNVLRNEKVPIYGKGEQVRDWIFVQDKCEAILTLLEKGVDNNIYNISAGNEISNVEMFQNICNTLGKGHDLLEFVKDRPGHDFRYSVNSDKLRALGWSPKFKFKQGLLETVTWYINNQWFLKIRD